MFCGVGRDRLSHDYNRQTRRARVAAYLFLVENLAIARLLGEIADLLELKSENPFKIRAYRSASQVAAESAEPLAAMTDAQLRELPGIGKDLAAKIVEIASTGTAAYHQELLQQFPPTILDLLRLQGIGPKTVALLYETKRIASIDELEAAASSGALRSIKGMGAKKEQLILKAIAERKAHSGRHLLADTAAVAEPLAAYLRERAPGAVLDVVGSLRRGCETCGDLDILVSGVADGGDDVMSAFVAYKLVDRILGQGETKSSVLLWKGYQADLRLVAPESRGAAMQYFTGSKAHNIALRQRALNLGLTLNEYGLFKIDSGEKVAGDTEEGIYRALGLDWIDPALRENRGEIAAAEAGTLPRLITQADLRGDLHMHTTETDGKDDIESMALAAREMGLEYIAITDHSKALAMANGLDETRALAHAARVREIGARLDGITLLAGIECDIKADGTMDLADDCLAQLDIVIGSVHSAFNLEPAQMTARLLRAIDNPYVDIIAHPTGRRLLSREAYTYDMEAVMDAAAKKGVCLEINSLIERLDLNDAHARLAKQRGVTLVIDSDAHSRQALAGTRWGVATARRAWLEAGDVLNTRPVEQFRQSLRRNQ
jgi:DNA polymerase (family 10)